MVLVIRILRDYIIHNVKDFNQGSRVLAFACFFAVHEAEYAVNLFPTESNSIPKVFSV